MLCSPVTPDRPTDQGSILSKITNTVFTIQPVRLFILVVLNGIIIIWWLTSYSKFWVDRAEGRAPVTIQPIKMLIVKLTKCHQSGQQAK